MLVNREKKLWLPPASSGVWAKPGRAITQHSRMARVDLAKVIVGENLKRPLWLQMGAFACAG